MRRIGESTNPLSLELPADFPELLDRYHVRLRDDVYV